MLDKTQGVHIITQTPFDEQGAVDFPSIDTLVDFYLRHGANGFTVLGVSGEASKLTPDEAFAVAKRFIDRAGSAQVVVGVSNASLAQLAELSAKVMDVGAAGVMIAPPGGLKTEEELFSYFGGVFAKIGNTPTILQDFPFSTGVWMSVPSIVRLVETHAQIQVLKEEDIPSLGKISRLRDALGRRIAILTGNNAMYLPLELDRGVDGPMAGFSYPEMLSGVYRLHQRGQIDDAYHLFSCYLPLLNYEAQGVWGVAARKEMLRRRGAIRHANMRMPGPKLGAAELRDIDRLSAQVEKAVAALPASARA
jgi:4-hydroxy-tetrahydrodipicolinate synthase